MGLFSHEQNMSLAPPKSMQSGLMTPNYESEDPFESIGTNLRSHLPPSPANIKEDSKIAQIDDILTSEQEIDQEFNDGFVTQIYNYLSLGYPSMARKYDGELSKISKIPMEELRKDDKAKNSKGYVGAPEGTGLDMHGVQNGHCSRWIALRLYVREWARQQPRMADRDGGADDWGNRARRGSWAI